MITMNINLDTRIDPQPALLQFLIPGPVPYKYIALPKPCQIFAVEAKNCQSGRSLFHRPLPPHPPKSPSQTD